MAILPSAFAPSRTGLHPVAITPEMRGRLTLARGPPPPNPAATVLSDIARNRLRINAAQRGKVVGPPVRR